MRAYATLAMKEFLMSQDPIGLLGRINALSLMLITPEFYKFAGFCTPQAFKIDYATGGFRHSARADDPWRASTYVMPGVAIPMARPFCSSAHFPRAFFAMIGCEAWPVPPTRWPLICPGSGEAKGGGVHEFRCPKAPSWKSSSPRWALRIFMSWHRTSRCPSPFIMSSTAITKPKVCWLGTDPVFCLPPTEVW